VKPTKARARLNEACCPSAGAAMVVGPLLHLPLLSAAAPQPHFMGALAAEAHVVRSNAGFAMPESIWDP